MSVRNPAARGVELAYAESSTSTALQTATGSTDLSVQISFTQGPRPIYVVLTGHIQLLKNTATAGSIATAQLRIIDTSDSSIFALGAFQGALPASSGLLQPTRAEERLAASPGTARTYKGTLQVVTIPSGAQIQVLASSTFKIKLKAIEA